MSRMFVRSITLKNLLSFRETTLELRPLNVLIGPNASGKSNLIDTIGLLQAAPTDLAAAMRLGGGAHEWIWKGEPATRDRTAWIECVVQLERELSYQLRFGTAGLSLEVVNESLRPWKKTPDDPDSFVSRGGKILRLAVKAGPGPGRTSRTAEVNDASQSVLESLKGPVGVPEATSLARSFASMQIYRDWDTSSGSGIRRGAPATIAGEQLAPDGGNLALVLNEMQTAPEYETLVGYLRRLLDGFQQIFIMVKEGAVVVRLKEEGIGITPASRLSDGTLRFLCLMTALFHPNPPPLICIEEPEVGLHPDALQLVAEALQEASQRTQLIVTTHSEALVDALTDDPEAIVVCEKDSDNSTQFHRLEKGRLKVWLERYRLGQLWRKGEIGGNRW